MRPIERIDRISQLLASLWKKHPDMRLGQLLLNVARDSRGDIPEDIWNIEDTEWEVALTKICQDGFSSGPSERAIVKVLGLVEEDS